MRYLMAACLLALLAGCANHPLGNPNRAMSTPYYVEPEAASVDLNMPGQ